MIKCLSCKKETNNPKYCSKSCAARVNASLYPRRKHNKTCLKCDEPVKTYRHKHCEFHWKEHADRSINREQMTLREFWERKSIKDKHPSYKNVAIRQHARDKFKHLTKQPCARCRYTHHVELCHVKAISTFPETATLGEVNSHKNVVQLCPNCHWELDHNVIQIIYDDSTESFRFLGVSIPLSIPFTIG